METFLISYSPVLEDGECLICRNEITQEDIKNRTSIYVGVDIGNTYVNFIHKKCIRDKNIFLPDTNKHGMKVSRETIYEIATSVGVTL